MKKGLNTGLLAGLRKGRTNGLVCGKVNGRDKMLSLDFDARNIINTKMWVDKSVYSSHAYSVNNPTVSTDNGGTVNFNGSTQCYEVPFNPNVNPALDLTISAWVRLGGGAGQWRSIISNRNSTSVTFGYAVYANLVDKWQVLVGNGIGGWATLDSVSPAQIGVWTHVCFTVNRTTLRAYINGQFDVRTTLPAPPVMQTGKLVRIGAGSNETAAGFFFNGRIAKVQQYNRAFSAEEIYTLFQKDRTRFGL